MLKMEVASACLTSVKLHQSIRRHVQEDSFINKYLNVNVEFLLLDQRKREQLLWTFTVSSYCEQLLWTVTVSSYCEQLLWTVTVSSYCEQ